jgi:hypothetical protein
MKNKNIIGFWGLPHPKLIEKYKKMYPQALWVDFDIDYNYKKQDILPESYCAIIKNIINCAFHFKDELLIILAPIGKDKCDSGWFAYEILKDMNFPIISSIFEEKNYKKEVKISTSNLPLKQKVELITKNIYEEKDYKVEQCKPEFGFWGVPPNDLSILDLFPSTTHLYGWTRCVEAMTPSDIELEMFVDKNVPTVFYSQSFCSKAQLAKYLADKYNGLFIDIDDTVTNSTKAKIEAFLRLR